MRPQIAQRFGGTKNFEIDPAKLGVTHGGGQPLPGPVLAKMEAAFGADFSAVRVHVGSQASRIGAVAFTMGNELYFAPGKYQPDSVQGQQLIGHELAHVIQQRQGRVRASGVGVAVVQDHALEAEADRLGMRAAMLRTASDTRGHGVQRPTEPVARRREPVARSEPECGSSTGHGGDCGGLPSGVQRRIDAIARSGDLIQSQKAFSLALPGLVSQIKRHRQSRAKTQAGAACACGGCAEAASSRNGKAIQGKGIIQAANCRRVVNGANQDVEWYTRSGAQVRQSVQHSSGMHIDNDIAHTLCCAFCEAQIRTFAEGGVAIGAMFARYTQLFEHYVHEYVAVGQNIFTEEVYWVPENALTFGNAIGLAAPAGGHAVAYLFDNILWNNIRTRIINLVAGMVGAFPTGLPAASQIIFIFLNALLNAEAVPGAPAVGRRRSYAGDFVRNSALYAFIRLINHTAPTLPAGTEWHQFRELRGTMRILDFTGESAGGKPAVVDAKFSYGANFDVFGPRQNADQLLIHQSLPGGAGAANNVPAVTWHLCGCNQGLLKDMLFDQMRKKIDLAAGKRNEGARVKRARIEYESDSKKTKFISSADVKWVKQKA